ncbi:LysE family translocator [Actinomycetospora sp. NBRC 106378]|uniref:LysE family translocator n=1 Tax=Actinomycetospora sp. NBRC 106378 TaxID=3032208 RepID=UPI0024A2C240|nr:LysE family translocator [Actinomycetospora sp. NBRC 106378]GLZ51625.1 lysine transporter LysE [Actinomycetospora sp. NBRC 106378]
MDSRLVAFLAAAALVIVIPGPSVVFAISRALAVGRRSALASVVGNALGVLLQVAGLAIGLGELIERSVVAFTVIKLVGAAYLVWLGVQAIRHRHDASEQLAVAAPEAATGLVRSVLRGVPVGLFNPKTVVFFAAFLPLFVDPARSVPRQLLVLGALFAGIAVVLDSIWAMTAASARAWFSRSPRRLAGLGAVGGVAMIGLGAGVATAQRAT